MTTYPLLDSQIGILLACSSHPASTAWNLPSVIEFEKSISVVRLTETIGRICDARPELHIQFLKTETGEIRQFADLSIPIPISSKRMSDEEAEKYMRQGFVRPFSLFAQQPLCRFEVVETNTRVLLLSDLHHSIADGFTIAGRLMGVDLSTAYERHSLSQPRMTLFEWSLHEKEQQYSPSYNLAKSYYQQLFSDCEVTHLAATTSDNWGRRASFSFSLSKEILNEWCCQRQLQANHLLMAAFCLTLGKLANKQRVVFSTLYHGRYDKKLSEAYGMFVDTIPFLAELEPSMTVYDLMTQIRRRLMNGLRHRAYPYTHFCQDTGIIPKITFGFQSDGIIEQATINGQHYKGRQIPSSEIPNDLSVMVYSSDARYEIRLEASSALYSPSDLSRFGNAMQTCLLHLMQQENQTIDRIELIDEQQKANLLRLSAGERTQTDNQSTIVSLIIHQAEVTPNAIAVDDTDHALTYTALEQQSRALAHWLVDKGVGQGSFVGIDTTPCCAFLIGTIAIMRAGGAYVPIDPNLPSQRKRHILTDAGINIILDATVINKHSTPTPSSPSINRSHHQGAAYMIYTSGTTGMPKGVVVRHEGLSNLVHFCVRRWPITPHSRIACHSTMAFDASVEDLFPALTVGGCVMPVPEKIRTDIDALASFINDNHITGGCYTTRLGVALAHAHPLNVEYLCLGGERLLVNPSVKGKTYNTYGPTEFTVDATYYELEKGKQYSNIPIGRPVDNCHAFVVDSFGCLVPQGAMGELWLAGPQMAAGYWNAPLLTAERFTSCSFFKGKVYHTGDLVRWNEDGFLEYVGRKDSQLKINGIRVNLEEIEQRLLDIANISQAAVVTREINGKPRLLAYYTHEGNLSEKEITDTLKQWLPPQMIPYRLIPMEEMPQTLSGKIDRHRLPFPEPTKSEGKETANPTEGLLCALIGKILGETYVNATDDFFAIGGTSLSAMQLVTEARRKGLQLSYGDIFSHPTPRQLSMWIAHDNNEGEDDINNFDYQSIDHLLSQATATQKENVRKGGIILLTGSTGFLGIHLLHRLLHSGKWKVVCMIRCRDKADAEKKLLDKWIHYFGEEPLATEKADIIYGDLTEEESIKSLANHSFDIIVNCAADTRYFAKDNNTELVNNKGVEYLTRLCVNTRTPFIQISTMSVGGLDKNGKIHSLTPRQLYQYQHFVDLYSRSKFLAERHVLDLIARGELEGTIIRVGFLTPYSTDGLVSWSNNKGLLPTTMLAMSQIGGFPYMAKQMRVSHIPVDRAAERIDEIISLPLSRPIWHVVDEKEPLVKDLAEHLAGKPLQEMSDEAFIERLQTTPFSQFLTPFFKAMLEKTPQDSQNPKTTIKL